MAASPNPAWPPASCPFATAQGWPALGPATTAMTGERHLGRPATTWAGYDGCEETGNIARDT